LEGFRRKEPDKEVTRQHQTSLAVPSDLSSQVQLWRGVAGCTLSGAYIYSSTDFYNHTQPFQVHFYSFGHRKAEFISQFWLSCSGG